MKGGRVEKGMMLLLCMSLGCSGGSTSDNNKPDDNNDSSSNTTNNSNAGTNSATNNTNSSTNNGPGSNNDPGTNNTTGTNNMPDPRSPFAGLCNAPETMRMDDGCTVFWRCSAQLTLACTDDGAGTATCACTKDGVAANSFTSPVDSACGDDEPTLTQLAADECSWDITYMNALSCDPAVEVSGRAACSWAWDCGGMEHKIDCTDDRNGGYDCTCVIDNRPTGAAFPANVCGATEADAIRAARAGCGWDIMTN